MSLIKNSKVYFVLCGTLILLLTACNNIERKIDEPVKKLAAIINPFKTKKIWEQKLVTSTTEQILNSAILLSKNEQQLFTADLSGVVVAIDLNGKILWKQSINEPITAGPVLFGDHVFVATATAKLACLNAKTGSVLWIIPVSSEVLSAPVFSAGMVFVRTIDGGLSAISLPDGKQLWRLSTVVPAITLRRGGSPSISGDYIVTGFANGKVVAVNKQDGTVLWSHNISNPKGRSELQRMTDISADPIIVGDIVYAVSYQGHLTAIRLKDGEILWEREISSYSGMLIDKNAIYLATVTGKVLAINLNSGTTLWVQEGLEGRVLSKPVFLKDYIVLGDQDGDLHFLNRSYGYIKGRISAHSSGIFITPLIDNKNHNRLYVLSNNGYLAAIEMMFND